jgi:hypothetical protein
MATKKINFIPTQKTKSCSKITRYAKSGIDGSRVGSVFVVVVVVVVGALGTIVFVCNQVVPNGCKYEKNFSQ